MVLIAEARRTLGDDHTYDPRLDAVTESLRDAVKAIDEKAEDVQARIKQAVAHSDDLLSTLEVDERAADG